MTARLKAMPPDTRRQASTSLCGKLAALTETRDAGRIGAFVPLSDEPDVTPFLRVRFAAGVRMALPVPNPEGRWCFRWAQALEPMEQRELGLWFPPLGDEVGPQDLDLILVPGRAFTWDGKRLGRGAGIYDRLLADFQGPRLGIAFSCQMVGQLPSDPHDIRMTRVVF